MIAVSVPRQFVDLCPDLKVVVAMGDGAQAVARRSWQKADERLPPLLPSPHPMIYGRGGAERQVKLAAALRRAAKLTFAADPRPGHHGLAAILLFMRVCEQ